MRGALVVTVLVATLLLPAHYGHAQDGSGTPDEPSGPSKVDWEKRLSKAIPKPNQPVYLLVHSAGDCSFCQRWKTRLGGQGEFEHWAKAHPDVHLVLIERRTLASQESPENYPDALRVFYETRLTNGKLSPGVPLFEAAMGTRLVYRSHGYSSWDRKMFPALKQLEARRGRGMAINEENDEQALR